MRIEDDGILTPGLEQEWSRQEAARRRLASPQAGMPQSTETDDGYARLFAVIGDAHDVRPPGDLAAGITAALEARASATRQVDAFRHQLRRCAWVAIAAALVVAGAQLRSTGMAPLSAEIATLAQSWRWLLLPGLAVLAGMLPVQGRQWT